MSKDMKSMGGHCYMSHCCRRTCYWVMVLFLAWLIGWGISAFLEVAPQSVIVASAATVILLLIAIKIGLKKRMMRRMLEIKMAKFVPDIYVTQDDKTKSLTVHITASKHGSCVLKNVWECEDSSADSGSCSMDKDLVKMKLPWSIKMGTELALKLPAPAMKSTMDDGGCAAKIGMKFFVPMLQRKIVVKICPYSYCVCYHVIHCK